MSPDYLTQFCQCLYLSFFLPSCYDEDIEAINHSDMHHQQIWRYFKANPDSCLQSSPVSSCTPTVSIAGPLGPGARPVAPREVHELRHRVAGHGRPQQPLVQEHQGLQAPPPRGEEEGHPSPSSWEGLEESRQAVSEGTEGPWRTLEGL